MSNERILTTHAGSLPRPQELIDLFASDATDATLRPRLKTAVNGVVRRQAEIGVDIVDDGEYGKATRAAVDFGAWASYATQRLGGWEVGRADMGAPSSSGSARLTAFFRRRDWLRFDEFYRDERGGMGARGPQATTASLETPQFMRLVFTGPITYVGQEATKRDITNLKEALNGSGVQDAFMCSVAPGSFGRGQNFYYKTDEEFLFALAEALSEEYKAITDAGFIVQIDDPGLPDSWDMYDPAPTIEEYRRYANITVEALNHGLRDIPEDRIRYHICWGSWHGPHTTDMPLEDVADLVLKVRAGSYSIEAGNVRHEHEWHVWEKTKLPDGKVLIPGVVSHATNVVEHPELVAERLTRYASVAGRENIMAGTDCGLGGRVHPQIAWAKLEALVAGAHLASQRLWK